MPTTSPLHKVRAGWYETDAEPVAGTVAVYRNDDTGYWEIARYEVNEFDGGLDLVGQGMGAGTLADAREQVAWLLAQPV